MGATDQTKPFESRMGTEAHGFIRADLRHPQHPRQKSFPASPSIHAGFQPEMPGKPHQSWASLDQEIPKTHTLSFPRKRESISRAAWIPAFAGMTSFEASSRNAARRNHDLVGHGSLCVNSCHPPRPRQKSFPAPPSIHAVFQPEMPGNPRPPRASGNQKLPKPHLLSFPRKRESISRAAWIPAFAGMTSFEESSHNAARRNHDLVGHGYLRADPRHLQHPRQKSFPVSPSIHAGFQPEMPGKPHQSWASLDHELPKTHTLSFPRKRESMSRAAWIPAFAGMTTCEVRSRDAAQRNRGLVGHGYLRADPRHLQHPRQKSLPAPPSIHAAFQAFLAGNARPPRAPENWALPKTYPLSFPRKRESISRAAWIPACAGMTAFEESRRNARRDPGSSAG